MNQYCRYCNHAFLQGDDDIWCEEKDEIREGRQVTRMNHCPNCGAKMDGGCENA